MLSKTDVVKILEGRERMRKEALSSMDNDGSFVDLINAKGLLGLIDTEIDLLKEILEIEND